MIVSICIFCPWKGGGFKVAVSIGSPEMVYCTPVLSAGLHLFLQIPSLELWLSDEMTLLKSADSGLAPEMLLSSLYSSFCLSLEVAPRLPALISMREELWQKREPDSRQGAEVEEGVGGILRHQLQSHRPQVVVQSALSSVSCTASRDNSETK